MNTILKILIAIFLLSITTNCDTDSSESAGNPNSDSADGQGGSLATFTLKGEYLYVVDNWSLHVFQIGQSENPVKVNSVQIGWDIETLFGYQDYLYIGSRNGMFIYSLEDPESPTMLSNVQHFTACDPVVANDTHAFVTLHSNVWCGNDINLLEIYDVKNVTEPILINSRNLVEPKGLGLYGNYLIICDDEIKIFDITNPEKTKLITAIDKYAFDVIINGDILMAIGESGLYQYQLDTIIEENSSLQLLSSITL